MNQRWTTVMVVMVLLMASRARGSEVPTKADLGFLDARVKSVMEEWQAPGAVAAVIVDGELVYSRAFGVMSTESREPVDFDETRFRLASISKPVTASAVMKLHQEGRLDLESDVHRYLGELRFEGPGILTTAHLLTHTGGFEDRFLTRMSRSPSQKPELEAFLVDQMPRRVYAAGEVSLYSNHGMALAGLIVERIAGRPFAEAARELVFEPLEMFDSSFLMSLDEPRLAQGYRFGEQVTPAWINTVPASMLVSTGADMARFMTALLEPEQSPFLDRETVDLMLTRHFEHHPTFTGRAYGFSEDSTVSPRRLFHSGSLDGFSAGIVLLPELSSGVLVAFNGNAYVWGLINETLDRVFPKETISPAGLTAAAQSTLPAEAARGHYVPAELPRGSLDKARSLFEQIEVASTTDGALLHRGRRYEPLSDGAYADDSGRIVVTRESSGGELLLEEGAAWRRVPWHAHPGLHLSALALLSVALVLAVFGRPLVLSRYRLERSLPHRCLRLAASLLLIFFVGTGTLIGITMSQGGGVLRFEVPWYLMMLLLLPFLALASTGVALAAVVRRRRTDERSTSQVPVVAVSWIVLFASAFLFYWRLLGFHF